MTLDDLNTRLVTLPNGDRIRAEVAVDQVTMTRGMMFRDRLDADRGMLFLHAQAGRHPYWMYQVRIPLDIIWMDRNRRIVEIAANTPPCPSTSYRECPSFGGNHEALAVLELAGGEAARRGLRVGDQLNF